MFHLLDLERSGDFKTTQQVTKWLVSNQGGALVWFVFHLSAQFSVGVMVTESRS